LPNYLAPDATIAALNKAKELNPKSLSPLLHLAKIHAMQKKFDAAVEDLNQALAMDSDNVAVLLLRAGVYQEKGDKEKAMAEVEKKFAKGRIDRLDGVSIEFDDFWFNVRPSNTEPIMRIMAEGKTMGDKREALKERELKREMDRVRKGDHD